MSSCKVCVKSISSKSLKLECYDCKGEFHATCLKFSKADVDCVTEGGLTWRCNDCAAARRKSMRFDLDTCEGKLTLEDVMKVVTEIRDGQKNYEKSVNNAFSSLEVQLEENRKALGVQNEQNAKLLNLIEGLQAENTQLRMKVKTLEDRVEEMEQYSRRNCVEIQGIPRTPTEDVLTIVKDVGKAMDMEISDAMVDVCHRLGPARDSKNNTTGIIVKFVRRIDKEEFLKRRRVKRTLSTRHIGGMDDRPIFVNESLTPARRKLHAQAKTFKKDNGYQFLWVRNGKIFLRRKENEPVKVINCQEDLK